MLNGIASQGILGLISIMLIGSLAFAQEEKYEKSTLEVTGRGEVKIKPDVAYLTLSVETNAKKASEAVRRNAERMTNVINKLKSLVGKEDKITTTGYQLFPVYEYNEKMQKSELTGYRATNQVVVETKGLNELGKLIDSTAGVGANRVDSLSFGTDRKEEYRKQALAKAIQDARETAEAVAKAAGVKTVKILKISPSYDIPVPVYREFAAQKLAVAEETALTPIEPGELTVDATVSMVFEIQ